jgi:hypothetical protein
MAEYTLPDEWIRRLSQMWNWQRNFRVTGAEFQNTPNGVALTIRTPETPQYVKQYRPRAVIVLEQLGDGGMYSACFGTPKEQTVTTGKFVWTDCYDFPDPDDDPDPELVVVNDAEENKARHDIVVGSKIRVFPSDMPISDLDLPVYTINYNHAVRNVKWFDATGELKQTFEDKEDPGDATYELITDFTNCP